VIETSCAQSLEIKFVGNLQRVCFLDVIAMGSFLLYACMQIYLSTLINIFNLEIFSDILEISLR